MCLEIVAGLAVFAAATHLLVLIPRRKALRLSRKTELESLQGRLETVEERVCDLRPRVSQLEVELKVNDDRLGMLCKQFLALLRQQGLTVEYDAAHYVVKPRDKK